jgi:hypothetical protein
LIRQAGGVVLLLSDQPALRNHPTYSSVLSGQQAGGSRQYQKFQITMTQIPNFYSVLVIEYWNLRFVWHLVLGIWDFAGLSYSIIPLFQHQASDFSLLNPWVS